MIQEELRVGCFKKNGHYERYLAAHSSAIVVHMFQDERLFFDYMLHVRT